jgi:predicted dienelactone hydrolase
LENDPTSRSRHDTEAVGVLGFHLGGTAALALVGARIDAQRYAWSCDPGGTGIDCDWLARHGIDLRNIDPARVARSHLDRRVRAAVAVDPELSAVFDPASLSAIAAPAQVINLGQPDAIRAGLEASSPARAIPRATYAAVAGATASSALISASPRSCDPTSGGDDEALCRDGQRPRAGVHALVAQMTASLFAPTSTSPPAIQCVPRTLGRRRHGGHLRYRRASPDPSQSSSIAWARSPSESSTGAELNSALPSPRRSPISRAIARRCS